MSFLVLLPCFGEASLTLSFVFVDSAGRLPGEAGYDSAATGTFFDSGTADGAAARTILGEAADVFEGILGAPFNADDSSNVLAAISPGGGNSWTSSFTNPTTGLGDGVVDLTIAQGDVVIYAGGRELGGSTLAVGERAGFSTASGTREFVDNVGARGQAGAITSGPNMATPVNDIGPWGGAVAFDSVGTAWDFVSGSASYSGSNFDFYSVAVHELAHVLGFGTTPSYDNYVDSGTFTGPRATAVNSNTAVALEPFDNYHLDEGILDPTLTAGTRETWGTLETAVMQDIWNIQAVPEPSTITILLPLLYSALFFRNRRKMVAS